MEIYGYGEDALTLWALQKKMGFILGELEGKPVDVKALKNLLVFYRPSFGRGGNSSFGEFDAIIASSKNVYLIESKWDGFKGSDEKDIELSKIQVLRHKVFSWYLNNWNDNWEDFSKSKRKPIKSIPKGNSILANNLQMILTQLKGKCENHKTPINVLLYFCSYEKNKNMNDNEGKEKKEKRKKYGLDFEMVRIDYGDLVSYNIDTKKPKKFIKLK